MHTVPSSSTLNTLLKASQASNNEISFTKALVCFGEQVADLSCDNFTFKHGWFETVTFAGSGDIIYRQTPLNVNFVDVSSKYQLFGIVMEWKRSTLEGLSDGQIERVGWVK